MAQICGNDIALVYIISGIDLAFMVYIIPRKPLINVRWVRPVLITFQNPIDMPYCLA